MGVTYHPSAQKDVNRVLKHYDSKSKKLGDEFWEELTSFINVAAQNAGRSHLVGLALRRVSLRRFPYHFLFRLLPDKIRITVIRHHKSGTRKSAFVEASATPEH
jgi:plasmid stabilization system protein ParE